MRARKRDIFTTIRTEGHLLPMDLLQRISEGDRTLKGLTPENYHIGKNERLNEVINRAWKRCQTAWNGFQKEYQGLPDADTGTTLTRERWLLVLFQELAYGRLLTSKAREIGGKSYPVSHFWNHTPIHLVSFRQNLDRRTPGVAGAARLSPHGLVQEFLNRSSDHLWGMVSNGLCLRLLRDNASLTRQAYVEFDLEGMMSGEVYSDFILLFLLLHQSRVEAEKPEQCWLEQWTLAAQEQGTRALDQLRSGVEQAITALGKGLLAHPGNGEIREKLRNGELTAYNMYQQILRLVYRLIFLFVAEDRNLLLLPEAAEKAKRLYLDHYSLNRFRRMAGRVRGTRHADLWEGLRVTFFCLYQGEPALGLDPLGSFLFSPNAMPDLNHAGLSNDALLEAIRRLSYTTEGRSLRPVDYRNLGTEELGSVYESLLELHPEVNNAAATFDLRIAAGSDRKTTGSYYTPSSLINCLLDSALEPVIESAIEKPDPEKALLNLKVVDPACGSGHFLIAAAHRLAKHLAMIRTGEAEPAPEERRKAIRDVVSHCIYGVDLNPLAVELCKVALWIETLDPGKPLGFLDHHIKCGNSLLGATPELLEKGIPDDAFKPVTGDDKKVAAAIQKKNRDERKWKQKNLFSGQGGTPALADTIEEIREWGFMPEDSQQCVNDKADKYHALMDDPGIRLARDVANLWTSVFFWPLTKESAAEVPTEDVFRLFKDGSLELSNSMEGLAESLARQHRFFHWHLEFPEVFGDEGGFDCVLGNPPWERTALEELEFFATRSEEVLMAQTTAERRSVIEALEKEDSPLYYEYLNAKRAADTANLFINSSSRYELGARGRLNTYAIFTDLGISLISNSGRLGMVVPTGIAIDSPMQNFCRFIMWERRLVSLIDFENKKPIFPSVHREQKFCLLTLTGSPRSSEDPILVGFWLTDLEQLSDNNRVYPFSLSSLTILSPNTGQPLLSRCRRDSELVSEIYQNSSLCWNDSNRTGEAAAWVAMTSASYSQYFVMEKDLTVEVKLSSWILKSDDALYLPLIEAKQVHQYDPSYANYEGVSQSDLRKGNPLVATTHPFDKPILIPKPRFWASKQIADQFLTRKVSDKKWILTYRDVTNVNNERTVIACVLPRVGILQPLNGITCTDDELHVLASLNSFPCDYVARQRFTGRHLNVTTFNQLPIPKKKWEAHINPRVLELSYICPELISWAKAHQFNAPPFRWDVKRRFKIRCELDAALFLLYGINRENINYIMETFPIVKRKDEQKYGDYRTKQVILERYDAMAEAMKTGKPYQTILDPPPGPPLEGLPEWKAGQPKPKDWPAHIHAPNW